MKALLLAGLLFGWSTMVSAQSLESSDGLHISGDTPAEWARQLIEQRLIFVHCKEWTAPCQHAALMVDTLGLGRTVLAAEEESLRIELRRDVSAAATAQLLLALADNLDIQGRHGEVPDLLRSPQLWPTTLQARATMAEARALLRLGRTGEATALLAPIEWGDDQIGRETAVLIAAEGQLAMGKAQDAIRRLRQLEPHLQPGSTNQIRALAIRLRATAAGDSSGLIATLVEAMDLFRAANSLPADTRRAQARSIMILFLEANELLLRLGVSEQLVTCDRISGALAADQGFSAVDDIVFRLAVQNAFERLHVRAYDEARYCLDVAQRIAQTNHYWPNGARAQYLLASFRHVFEGGDASKGPEASRILAAAVAEASYLPPAEPVRLMISAIEVAAEIRFAAAAIARLQPGAQLTDGDGPARGFFLASALFQSARDAIGATDRSPVNSIPEQIARLSAMQVVQSAWLAAHQPTTRGNSIASAEKPAPD